MRKGENVFTISSRLTVLFTTKVKDEKYISPQRSHRRTGYGENGRTWGNPPQHASKAFMAQGSSSQIPSPYGVHCRLEKTHKNDHMAARLEIGCALPKSVQQKRQKTPSGLLHRGAFYL